MRLLMFDDYRLGVLSLQGGSLVDITDLVGPEVAPRDRMSALIASWAQVAGHVADAAAGAGSPLAEARLLPPQPRPGKIIAAPVNYQVHQEEMGGHNGVYKGASIKTIETYAGFIKASSSITGPDGQIRLPFEDRRVDHEAELGVVIGRVASRVGRDAALDFVFGYVPLLDITVRGDEDRSYRKSFDTFTPIGPAIVTADEVGDPGDLDFELTVNGEPRQRATTRDLIYDVPRLIELYSEAMTLEPGDLIATGTPAGVGPVQAGDEVVLNIPAIGSLAMAVVARQATPA